ncbi:hypothetical protein U1Q18_036347 [Sarracenia purpurea var. burkii]
MPWGKWTPILENVFIILHLKVQESTNFDHNSLSGTDKTSIGELCTCLTRSSSYDSYFSMCDGIFDSHPFSTKSMYASWIRSYFKDIHPKGLEENTRAKFHGKRYKKELYLCAFISLFLSIFTIPGTP